MSNVSFVFYKVGRECPAFRSYSRYCTTQYLRSTGIPKNMSHMNHHHHHHHFVIKLEKNQPTHPTKVHNLPLLLRTIWKATLFLNDTVNKELSWQRTTFYFYSPCVCYDKHAQSRLHKWIVNHFSWLLSHRLGVLIALIEYTETMFNTIKLNVSGDHGAIFLFAGFLTNSLKKLFYCHK